MGAWLSRTRLGTREDGTYTCHGSSYVLVDVIESEESVDGVQELRANPV